MNKALIILVKNPELGKVKTRLAATEGDENALFIYKKLLEYTKDITANLEVDVFVYYSDFIDNNDLWSSSKYSKRLQKGNNLGERMNTAFKEVFKAGYDKVIAIGSDCIELTSNIITNGFTSLENTNCTIGPAVDGGYYLIGLNQFESVIFEDISWSTDVVLKQTKEQLRKVNFTLHELVTLNDLDTIEDLNKLSETKRKYLLHE
jgi:hypothetical protein